MLTPAGQELLFDLLALDLAKGSIEISDGKKSARASVEKSEVDDGVLKLVATFAADVANFEWRERRVVASNGNVIDKAVEDGGRKAAGAVWQCTVELKWES